jgi:HTH-type transcriptional regulator/antitoxin HipB
MSDTHTRKFAARLKVARKARGLTQIQLGALAGIDRGTIGDIERGRRPPGFHQLLRLHKALKTTPGELFAA